MSEEEKKLTEEQQLILDLFEQSCRFPRDSYNHQCISAYEDAQRYLIKHGLISEDDCEYR